MEGQCLTFALAEIAKENLEQEISLNKFQALIIQKNLILLLIKMSFIMAVIISGVSYSI
jgi:hypothetical protein